MKKILTVNGRRELHIVSSRKEELKNFRDYFNDTPIGGSRLVKNATVCPVCKHVSRGKGHSCGHIAMLNR